MKRLIPKQKTPIFNKSIYYLHKKTEHWIAETEFIKIEQNFLKELLTEHVINICKATNFQKAKLLLKGIYNEKRFGEKLLQEMNEHRINLSLLIENIYLKKEDSFRKNHAYLESELENYLDNFKYLKEQVFELSLQIMKKQKQQRI